MGSGTAGPLALGIPIPDGRDASQCARKRRIQHSLGAVHGIPASLNKSDLIPMVH